MRNRRAFDFTNLHSDGLDSFGQNTPRNTLQVGASFSNMAMRSLKVDSEVDCADLFFDVINVCADSFVNCFAHNWVDRRVCSFNHIRNSLDQFGIGPVSQYLDLDLPAPRHTQ